MAEEATTQNEEVQGTPIVTDDMFDEHTGPVMEEPGVVKETDTAPSAQKAEEVVEPEVPESQDEIVDEPVDEITPAVTLDDPGEFVPNDYSFESTIYDSEGKNGRTVKINSVEQFDELLEKDANFGSAAALMKASRQAASMESRQLSDQQRHEMEKEAYDAQVVAENAREERTTQYENEVAYLETKGELPPVDRAYTDADWSNPDIAKQSGVKERIELLNYMRDENSARIRSGLPPMTSVIDAFNALELDKARKAEVDARTRAGVARKAAGSRIAGNTPNPVSTVPKGVMVGRVRPGGLSSIGNEW